MFSCRVAWQRCGPLARRAAYRLPREAVQRRQMSSLPGGSGQNIVYTLLCGGAFVGAVSYAYVTVSTDGARYNERVAQIKARPKTEWVPKPWPPKSRDDEEDGEEEGAAAAEGEEEAAAADGEAETVVEAVAEVVGEAAEVVVEVAEGVAEAAQEVEKVAEEIAQVAEAVEEAAQAVAEPAVVTAEDPESNVLLAAASTLEVPKEEFASANIKVAPKEEFPAPEEGKPVEEIAPLEEAPASVEAAPVVEEAPTAVEAAPVVEEAPTPVVEEAAPVVEEAPAAVEDAPVVEEAPAAVVEASAPVDVAQVVEDPKREYIVVVLEGTPKAEKRPKVLGVGPMTGRIIPSPDDDDAPASEGRRRLLRMQMQ